MATDPAVWRARPWVALGCGAVAIVLLVAARPVAALQPGAGLSVPAFDSAAWWIGLALVVAQAVVIWLPAAGASVTLLLVAVGAPVAAIAALGDATSVTSAAVVVAAFLVVLHGPPRRMWPALAVAAALVGAADVVETVMTTDAGARGLWAAIAGGAGQGLITVGLPVVAGIVVRARRNERRAREAQAVAQRREHDALVEAAVARERTAMARELHDVTAHHLSGIAVMTGAIGRQIDVDPEGAKRAVLDVRTQSTELLNDLRKLVGLLRDASPRAASAAGAVSGSSPIAAPSDLVHAESLASIRGLVDASRRAGADVALTVHDAPGGRPPGERLGPLAELAAFRTVQESLANAARHAPGAHCAVVVDARDAGAVVISIRNDAAPGGHPAMTRAARPARDGSARDRGGDGGDDDDTGGFGIIGMRERAELTGARLAVGPTPAGGWAVTLALPALNATRAPEPREGSR